MTRQSQGGHGQKASFWSYRPREVCQAIPLQKRPSHSTRTPTLSMGVASQADSGVGRLTLWMPMQSKHKQPPHATPTNPGVVETGPSPKQYHVYLSQPAPLLVYKL